jgi:acetolactate synthase-1/2/3 large subunit
MAQMSAGRAIVEILKAEGVRAVFGMPGGHTLSIYDALYDTPQIRHVLARHEQVAASMAAGYAQLTGEPGVCCVTAGPGATNLVTGIAEAFIGALPIVILAGRAATTTTHRGASQEIAQDQVFRPITKWAVRVDRADSIVEILRQAFVVARSGKPGPVLVDLPRDLLSQLVEFDDYRPAGRPARVRPQREPVRRAAEALVAAKRPLLVAGGGVIASDASAVLRQLAERLSIPVLTTLSGRGSLPDDHPLAVGGLGHHRTSLTRDLLPDADVVLGVGCRFEEQETNWQESFLPSRKACYIQVDIDGAELGRSVQPQIGIVGDAREVLQDLLEAVKSMQPGPANGASTRDRLAKIEIERAKLRDDSMAAAASEQKPLHPLRPIRIAREVFPRDSVVSIDVGVLAQGMAGAFPNFDLYEPRTTIVPSSFYGMGFTAAALPVAKLVYPDRPALGFVGDGSFQMIMNVLPTAAEHGLPVTWCVLNDQALGSIWDGQRNVFKSRFIGTTFDVQPDFAQVARACGCHGERVENAVDVEPALRRALEANRRGQPAVIDFLVAKERLEASTEFFTRK